MENIMSKLKENFRTLMKKGKEGVWLYIEEAEKLGVSIDNPNEYDGHVADILKQVREEKRFDFEQYKEVRRFIIEHQRLNSVKPQEDSDFIIL